MSDEGVFAVHRGIFDHPLFEGETYSKRDAWTWLLSQAAWKPTRVRMGGKVIDLKRGQLAFSERFLAKKWLWDKSKVHRFLMCLEAEAMLNHSTNHGVNQITICNYDNYQFSRTADRTTQEQETEPAANQQRTKEEELNKSISHTEGSARAIVSRGTRKSRSSPIPDDWQPNADHAALARRESLDLRDQTERFRDYLSSSGKQYANYDSAFRNFLKNAHRFGGNRNGFGRQGSLQNAGSSNSGGSIIDASDRLIEQLRAFDEPAPSEVRGGEGQASFRLISKG